MNGTQWMVRPGATEYQCPTTGAWYSPPAVKVVETSGHQFVWAYCPLCDEMGRTRTHPEFDALRPQPHCFTIEMEREV